MANELEELKAMYPVFKFKNKTAVPQEIALFDDSVQVPARAEVKLRSNKFTNLPPIELFTFIQPTLDDLRAVGLLSSPEKPKVEEKPPVTPTGSGGKGGTGGGKTGNDE